MNVVHLKKPRIFYENQYFCEGFEEILHYGMMRCRSSLSVCALVGFVYESMYSHVYGGQWSPWRVPNDFYGFFQKFTFRPFGANLRSTFAQNLKFSQSRGGELIGARNDIALKM